MGKCSFSAVFMVLGLAACGGSSSPGANAVVADGSVARTSIESPTCGANATLIELPDHCWSPVDQRSSRLLTRAANVVVSVDARGKPTSARVVDQASTEEANRAFEACAMQGRYRAAWNGAGDTCPVTIRLSRYASDIAGGMRETSSTECSHGGGIMYGPLGGAAPDRGNCEVSAGWYP